MQMPGMQGISGAAGSIGANALEKTNRSLQKILERLSTARRINRASDDAAGLGIAEKLTTQVRGFKQSEQNIQDAMAALNIADATTAEVADILQRQRELAIQAGSDTLTDPQRAAIDVEYQNLNQEIDRITRASNYNTQGVAQGGGLASGTAQVQVGPNSEDAILLPGVNLTTVAMGTQGSSVSTRADAQSSILAIDRALDTLNTQRSTLGATVNRMEHTLNNIGVAMTNTQAAESILRDQDLAQGVSDLVRAQLLSEGGTRVFSRFNEIASNHLFGLLQ